MAYGKYENPSFDGRAIICVQPFQAGQQGNIVEHPNRPGVYIISYFGRLAMSYTCTYNEHTDHEEVLYYSTKPQIETQGVVKAYQVIKNSGLVKPDHSFQMEFVEGGFEQPFYVTQVRAFVPFQRADFELPEGHKSLVIGVTPPEGIQLPLFHSPDGLDKDKKPFNETVQWALLKTLHGGSPPLAFQPKQLAAYLIAQSFYSGESTSLAHNHYRLAQKADVTIFEPSNHYFTRFFKPWDQPSATLPESFRRTAGPIGQVKIVSDGIRHKVEMI